MAADNFQSSFRNTSGVAFRALDAFLVERVSRMSPRHRDFRRVGFVHVRKSGGTSVVNSVSRALCGSDAMIVRADVSFRHVAKSNSHVIVGWNDERLRRGLFDFGYSHSPWRETFHPCSINSFTVVRDPIDRVVSLWKMYHGGSSRNKRLTRWKAQHSGEMRWGVGSLSDFMLKLPLWRANELTFSFAADLSARSAFESICQSNVRVFFLDDLLPLEKWLSNALDLEISFHREHVALISAPEIDDEEMVLLEKVLAPDIELVRMLRSVV